jgi:transposase InsO family protein
MDERSAFVRDHRLGVFSVAELCRRFGVSRKTGYKWLGRYAEGGASALGSRSRRPHHVPHETKAARVERIVALRRKYGWGAKKILRILEGREPAVSWPARSTIEDILKREGLVIPRRRRTYPGHAPRPQTPMSVPNEVWTTDFKGEFRLGNGIYCYPLTVMDGCSRYLLGCQGLHSTASRPAREVFSQLFREYGLPRIIRSDNGSPFASTALGRLSRLSVWWIRLGIIPELNEPAHPEQNGRHERMHRELKASVTRPPRANLAAQQRAFNHFREEYNEIRPHEGIGLETPASIYQPSTRPAPDRLPSVVYPAHLEERLVSENGGIRWNGRWVCVSHVLAGEIIGLEPIDDGLWDVYFGPVNLGRLDERTMRILDRLGRNRRRKV